MIIWTTNEADYPDHSFLYVSKLGDNANAGTKAAPLLTINAAIAIAEADAGYVTLEIAIVIGSGEWTENIDTTRTKAYKFIGDGKCVYKSTVLNTLNAKLGEEFINMELTGFADSDMAISGPTNVTFRNVIADRLKFTGNTGGTSIIRTLKLENVFVDEIYWLRAGPSGSTFHFDFNDCIIGNIDGDVSPSGTTTGFLNFYNIIFYGSTLSVINGSAVSGGFIDFNCFWNMDNGDLPAYLQSKANSLYLTDPLFKNFNIGDYTLRADSPCLYTGYQGLSIGLLNEGRTVYGFSDVFRKISGAEYTQSHIGGVLEDDLLVDVGTGEFYLEDGHDTGSAVSVIETLGSSRRFDGIRSSLQFGVDVGGAITEMPLYYDFRFEAYDNTKKYYEGDSCTASGTKYVCIKDYPAENPFVEYPPASSPTYWTASTIDTATNVSPNIAYRFGNTAADCEAADWLIMPLNGVFKIDGAGKGSGDPDYNPATAIRIRASFHQFKVKMKIL